MKGIKKGLAILLVLCTLLSMVVMTGAGTAEGSQDAQPLAASNDSFMKMVLLDGGRGYISVENVEAIIDQMALYDYDYLVLGFGNNGLRFLLDDMSVEVNGTTYGDAAIRNAIIEKNAELASNVTGEWTENDMAEILTYADGKDISIVPFLNTPGHATSIVAAMQACGIDAALVNRNNSTDDDSVTFDVTNSAAVAFVEAFVQKYIDYFANKGCTYFNLGMDEFAGNNAGWAEMDDAEKTALEAYLSALVSRLDAARMTPLAFCDVIKYMNVPSSLIGINWNGKSLSGHDNVNANYYWYYVLGTSGSGWAGYDRALSNTASTPVTQTIENTDANAGSLLAIWNDNYQEFTADEVANVNALIRTQATSNSTYFTNVPEERTVNLTIGGTYTDTIEGDYSDNINRAELDAQIADVAAEPGEVVTSANYEWASGPNSNPNHQYLITIGGDSVLTNTMSTNGYQRDNKNYWPGASGLYIEERDFLNGENCEQDLWTFTFVDYGNLGNLYTIQDVNGRYLHIGDNNNSVTLSDEPMSLLVYEQNHLWQISNPGTTYYLNDFGGNNLFASSWSGGNTLWALYSYTPVTSDATTVTFTGKTAGTTYATVGNVHYTINVTAEDLTGKTLTYHPWISTYSVHREGTGATNCNAQQGVAVNATIAASAPGVYSEQGAEISTLVYPTGDWRWEESAAQTTYWKATILSAGNHQEGETATDQSMNGTDFTYIRYWGGSWAYSSDQVNWTAIQDTDEVCAYYLQKTEVTAEIDTYVKDWAYTPTTTSANNGRYQKALSFAVVYPNGQLSPSTESEIYSQSTLIYWDNLNPMTFIRVGTNDIYEVEKITYTFGERASGKDTTTQWDTRDSINWEKETVSGTNNQWYKETVCWDENSGTEPVVNGADLTSAIYAGDYTASNSSGEKTKYNGTWGYNDAVLILIYLKPVVTEDSLTVRYWDDNANSEIYSYPVNISNTAGDVTGTFLNRLVQKSAVDAGEFTLDDDAYVVNAKDQQETFQKDLTKVPNLFGKYTSGLYSYVKADISEDGKTLTLHYNLNADKLSVSYVLDFGLPVTVPLSDLVENTSSVTKVEATVSSTAGTAVVNADDSITFTLGRVMTGMVTMSVTVTYSDGNDIFTVGFYPATTVYYEEGFATFGDEAISDSSNAGNQAAEVAGKHDNNYGYDDAYMSAVGDSNGTVATLGTNEQGTFVFTGTGVDVYARSTTGSGKVMVYLYAGSDNRTLKRLVTVDTRQLGDQSSSPYTAYNVPIVSLSGLAYGEYTIRMLEVQTKFADGTKKNLPVYIDGFRVYGTLEDQANDVYRADQEDSPVFIELRDKVLAGLSVNSADSQYANQIAENVLSQVYATGSPIEGSVLLSKNETFSDDTDVQALLDNGPKNEIYLWPNQALVFTINTNRVVQIGLKALNAATSYTINNGTAQDLNTSTDMFYTVPNSGTGSEQTITITNNGDGILAITKLKVCDDPNATLGELTAEDLIPALVSLGYEAEPVEAAATLNITVQAGGETLTTTLTATGTEGERHTFTAAEIQAAVETLELPEGYTLDGVTFEDVTVTCGEASDASFTAAESPAPTPVSPLQKIIQIAVKIIRKIVSWF